MRAKQYITEFLVDGQVSDGLRTEIGRLEQRVGRLGPAFESELSRMERASAMTGRRMSRFDPFGRAYSKRFSAVEKLKQTSAFRVTAEVVKQRKALAALYQQQQKTGRSSEKLERAIREKGRALKEAKRAAREHGLSLQGIQTTYDSYTRKVQRAERSVRRLAMAERAVRGTGRALGRGIDRGARYGAVAGGAALGAAVRYVGNLEDRIVRLGIAFQKPTQWAKDLKGQIFEIVQKKNIRLAPEQLFDAVEKIADKTGDISFVTPKNLESLGLAIQSTAAEGEHLAAIFTELDKFGFEGADALRHGLALIKAQGHVGSFTLQSMASQGERVASAMVTMGQGTKQGLKEMGALLQVFRKVTGSPEQSATVMEAIARQMWDKSDQIRKELGVRVTELSPETGEKVIRPLIQVIQEINEAVRGDTAQLSKYFEENARKGVLALKNKGIREVYEKAMSVTGVEAAMARDSALAADTPKAKITNIITSFKVASDKRLSGLVDQISSFLGDRTAEEQQEFINALMTGGGALGAAWMARKGIKGVSGLIKLLKGAEGDQFVQNVMTGKYGGVPGGGGGAPVRVTNLGLLTPHLKLIGGTLGKIAGPLAAVATAMGVAYTGGKAARDAIENKLKKLYGEGDPNITKHINRETGEIRYTAKGGDLWYLIGNLFDKAKQGAAAAPTSLAVSKPGGGGNVRNMQSLAHGPINVNLYNTYHIQGGLTPESEAALEPLRKLQAETADQIKRELREELDREMAQEWR